LSCSVSGSSSSRWSTRSRETSLWIGAIVQLSWAVVAHAEDSFVAHAEGSFVAQADDSALAHAEGSVVVMLFDGFAPSYLQAFETPAFDRIREEGAYSHAMNPVFPTLSLTNGVTISTGCWPKHHGIVSNIFLDPDRGRYDHATDADWLLACEHLHQAAERQQVATATLGWYGRYSGTRGPLASIQPADEMTYGDYPDDLVRAEQVLELIDRTPAERPRLILAYFKGPDNAGHYKGMGSPETREAVERSDAIVGQVMERIAAQPDADSISLVITTDHGMLPVTHLVNMHRILMRQGIAARAVSAGSSSYLYFDDLTQVPDALERLRGYEVLEVVTRDAQPDDWQIGQGARVGDLIVSVMPPYFIEDAHAWPWYLRFLKYVGPQFADARAGVKSTHGFPTGTPGVEGIFYAWGGAIARGREIESIRAIDIHPSVMHILDLDPGQPVDGVVVEELMRESRGH
jgi:predicted AlkP superfamily pyrophosphatase or phosphodiesterase